MAFLRNLFVPSLRNRLLVLTIMLVVVVSGSVLLVLNLEVQNLTNSKLQQDFTNTYRTFQRFLTLRNERLVESCYLISELPVLKAQLSTKDPLTISRYVLKSDESPAKLLEVDIFTLTNEKGQVLFRWDPYSDTILANTDGKIKFVDIKENITYREEVDDTTGQRHRVIIESKSKEE